MKNRIPEIVPHLWFDTQVEDAVNFYTAIFPNSQINSKTILKDTPSGDAAMLSFTLANQKFMAINGGPYFTLNPSISFIVNFNTYENKDAEQQLTDMWNKLLPGSQILMELMSYPFSKKYGWIQDKYGVSWQLFLTEDKIDDLQMITPSLLFVGDKAGLAEQAINFYTKIFKVSKINQIQRYPKEMTNEIENSLMYSDFELNNFHFSAMDSVQDHHFAFNEAVSFIINCETQEEIDYYWGHLSAVPESEQCGWVKDQFGISWQIVPTILAKLSSTGTPEQAYNMSQALLKMKKLNIAELEKAFNKVQ